MSARYTDAEMLIASQIAYWDIPKGCSLRSFIEANRNSAGQIGDEVRKIESIINETGSSSCLNWQIAMIANDQAGSGMYGIMINDGYGGAIFSFRGTEFDTQPILDGILADGGILDSTETWQQSVARDFIRVAYERHGNEYDSFSFTGHSLGGNLAIDAAINAPFAMRDKIYSIYGFDSPGFCTDYWDRYRQQIAEMYSRIMHYQWSFVGAIFETPGTTKTIASKEWYPGAFEIVGQHMLFNVDFNGDSVYGREQNGGGLTPYEKSIKDSSNELDNPGLNIPAWILAQIVHDIVAREKLANQGRIFLWNEQTLKYSEASYYDTATELEMNYISASAMGELFQKAETFLSDAAADMDTISQTIRYHSAVGGLLKMRIKYLSNRYEKDNQTVSALKRVINSTMDNYHNGDLEAAGLFEEFAGKDQYQYDSNRFADFYHKFGLFSGGGGGGGGGGGR